MITLFLALLPAHAGDWTVATTGTTNHSHAGHTALRLGNGHIFIAGAERGGADTETCPEIYDPAAGTWTEVIPNGWTTCGTMRWPGATWTRMEGGSGIFMQGLVSTYVSPVAPHAGWNASALSYIYQHAANTLTAKADSGEERGNATAIWWAGSPQKVIVVGGQGDRSLGNISHRGDTERWKNNSWWAPSAANEINVYYGALSGSWGEGNHNDGLDTTYDGVMAPIIIGGYLKDPAQPANADETTSRRIHRFVAGAGAHWEESTTMLSDRRGWFAQAIGADGAMVIIGGRAWDESLGYDKTLSSVDVIEYDSWHEVSPGNWGYTITPAADRLRYARVEPAASSGYSVGSIAVSGGRSGAVVRDTIEFCTGCGVEAYWYVATGKLTTPRYGHTQTRLDDGRLLVVGGYDGAGIALASYEILVWTP